MVVPADEGAALEVVQAELALELLVHALSLPAVLNDPNDLLSGHPARETGEEEFRRLVLTLWPFEYQPHWLPFLWVRSVVAGNLYPAKTEIGGEPSTCAFPPGHTPE